MWSARAHFEIFVRLPGDKITFRLNISISSAACTWVTDNAPHKYLHRSYHGNRPSEGVAMPSPKPQIQFSAQWREKIPATRNTKVFRAAVDINHGAHLQTVTAAIPLRFFGSKRARRFVYYGMYTATAALAHGLFCLENKLGNCYLIRNRWRRSSFVIEPFVGPAKNVLFS